MSGCRTGPHTIAPLFTQLACASVKVFRGETNILSPSAQQLGSTHKAKTGLPHPHVKILLADGLEHTLQNLLGKVLIKQTELPKVIWVAIWIGFRVSCELCYGCLSFFMDVLVLHVLRPGKKMVEIWLFINMNTHWFHLRSSFGEVHEYAIISRHYNAKEATNLLVGCKSKFELLQNERR